MRSLQDWIHWLEAGRGARWVWQIACLASLLTLSLMVAWKQFHGPVGEGTLLQADVGRQLARGEGFTTLVNYPQTAAVLRERGVRFSAQQAYPELHHAPLYSLVIGGGLRLLPAPWRERLFATPPPPPDGFGGDYFLLGLNLALFWLAVWQTYDLGRRVFSARVGIVAALALLVAVPVWQQVVAVNGTPLLMVLVLAVFQWLAWIERRREAERPTWGGWLALGGLSGLLFLAEYSAGGLGVVLLVYAVVREPGRRRTRALLALLVGAGLVATPWVVRNIQWTGHPVALAAQDLALRAGDPTAEPATVRALLTAETPVLSLAKLGNKTLTGVQDCFLRRIWSGGGMLLTAFFVAGWLYAFRAASANRLRWLAVAALAVLVVAQAFFGSGESERVPTVFLTPLIVVFGTAFFFVLVESSGAVAAWPRLAAGLLVGVQALPLVHDALEPRRMHFQYPPYFPSLFIGLRQENERHFAAGRLGLMTDVPAGLAWYGQARAWAQPSRLRDFYAIGAEQPLGALLLTPRTLDRPFFTELSASPTLPMAVAAGPSRLGEWGQIYAGLFTGRLPASFPLRASEKLADNLFILRDPLLSRGR